MIGAHSPEFPFEHDLEKIQAALDAMGVEYPIAVDNEFAVWRAFDNAAWPALYFVDAEGRIRHHHFGEEDYEQSERVIQQLLAEAGARAASTEDLVSVEPDGVELGGRLGDVAVAGDLRRLRAGHRPRFSRWPRTRPQPALRASPRELRLNHWALVGRLDGGGADRDAERARRPDHLPLSRRAT